MREHAIEQQIKLYAYDLMNEAREHGFKSTDTWKLSLVTNEERKKIQKEYYPTVAAQLYPEILLEVFHDVKRQLKQTLNKEEEDLNTQTIIQNEIRYIIAYNPKRQR